MTRMGRTTRGTSWLLATAMAFVMVPSLVTASKAPSQPPPPPPQPGKPQVAEAYGKLPLSFEANNGQTDSEVKFLARGRGYTLFLAQNEAVFVLRKAKAEVETEDSSRVTRHASREYEQTVLRMKLEGANLSPRASGIEILPGIVNYFIGNDPKKWRTNIPTYQKVEYKNMYPGIDVVYYGKQGKLEYDFVVSPGADPNQIKLALEGAENPRLADNGDVTLTVSGADLSLQKPLVYQQDENGRQQLVAGNYLLLNTDLPRTSRLTRREPLGRATPHVAFQVASYDRTRPLIIDPVLAYSTYLGGSGFDEGRAIAVDSNGNAYVTGTTDSADFPTLSAFQGALAGEGSQDAFVTKLNAAGSALVYSTYLGGRRSDEGRGIAVDANGNVYVTGLTSSRTETPPTPNLPFPTTPGAVQPTFGGGTNDAFVTKLNPDGSALVYSTYLGGTDIDAGFGLGVDTTESAYITGLAKSTDFPTTSGAFQGTRANSNDAFVTKLNPDGSALVYSTYLGSSDIDEGHGIAVDADGNAYVTGFTSLTANFPPAFPTTPGAIQPTSGGGSRDAFVTKLNSAGSGLVYSTFLGGSGFDEGRAIAVDTAGNVYVTGFTSSTDFSTPGAFDTTCGTELQPCENLTGDAFVTKLNPLGSALIYSTYLGGDSFDSASGIAADTAGSAYVTGVTFSTDFPTFGAIQPTFGGGSEDAFVTRLDAAGSALVYSTYLGGGGSDQGNAIAVHTTGSAYVTGSTGSGDFPPTQGALDTTLGGSDAFVTKFGNTSTGTNVTIQDGPVTVTFGTVTAAGDTTLTTSGTGEPPPAGFRLGAPPTYYEISTTADVAGNVTVCITYTDIRFGNEARLKLFHFGNQGWVDVTTSLNTTNDIICGVAASLSPFAILEPADQAFATFRPEVEIKVRPGVNNDTFEVEAFFTLSAGAGIAPLTEPLTLQVGPYSTTIPAGSFKEKKGRFKFKGVIDGVRLAAKIQPRARGGYKFEAQGKCADLDGTVNPVTVELTIGDDVGNTIVRAEIESSRKGGKCGDRRDDDKDDKHDKDDDDD